jgi:hypothetical protein
MMIFSYAVFMSVFGEIVRYCLVKLMSDFSFLRAGLSVKFHVSFFQMERKLISFKIKRGMKVH